MNQVEANAFGQDALGVLGLVRALKNSLAPVNPIPPEVLSLILDYPDVKRVLVTWTHVCRGWRNLFTSRSLLWTELAFANIDKTGAYIERSKFSPSKIILKTRGNDGRVLADLFSLVIPHIHRVKSLTIYGETFPNVIGYFRHRVPFLEELNISVFHDHEPALDDSLFNGDLSLRQLILSGIVIRLPGKGPASLRTVHLGSYFSGHDISRLPDFFESASLLHTVLLEDSLPVLSDAPRKRIISLSYLKVLSIGATTAHPILLNHLHIPAGVC